MQRLEEMTVEEMKANFGLLHRRIDDFEKSMNELSIILSRHIEGAET